jgi:hypothetical protein
VWKSCASIVNILWTNGQQKFFFVRSRLRIALARVCMRFRGPLRLIREATCVQFVPVSVHNFFFVDTVTADLHRYQESIGGRSYLIEVAPVSQNRWRAYIVRIPGIPTALMPFYGPTPAAAARLLCDWLTRAHQQAAAPRPM